MKFETFLETVNIEKEEKQVLLSLKKNLANLQRYNCRKIRVTGEPGTGKTELVKRLLTDVKIPVIYLGLEPEKNYIYCKNSVELLETVEKHKRCVIFLDDIQTIMRSQEEDYTISKEDGENLSTLFNIINKSQNRALILIASSSMLSSKLIDRIDAQISIDIPTKKSKISFIRKKYPALFEKRFIDYLSTRTIGYTFRDIESLVKIVGSSNEGLSFQKIDNALPKRIPSALSDHNVIYVTDVNFDSIVGRDCIKEQLKRAINSLKNKELATKLGINTKNLLFFYGPPGTGKTFMVKALAGELKLPIISINASSIMRSQGTPFEYLKDVIAIGSRFGDSILLFDEAEKIFGKDRLGDDQQLQGDLQGYLDGAGKKLKSLVIFTLNEQTKFGEPLKDRFLMFKFDRPSIKERTEFLERKYKLAKDYFSIKASVKELSKMLNEQSFREMEKVWDQTLLKKLTTKDKTVTLKDFEETTELLKIENENILCG